MMNMRLHSEAMWQGVTTAIINDGVVENHEIQLLHTMLHQYIPPRSEELLRLKELIDEVVRDGIVTSRERAQVQDCLRAYVATLSPSEKGDEFERCVLKCFSPTSHSLIEWRSDKHLPGWGAPRSNQWPDLVMEEVKTGRRFAVECKYRSRTENGVVKWSYPKQRQGYCEYELREKIPVYVALGLGGSPDAPCNIYLIRLRRIASHVINLGDFANCKLGEAPFELDPDND